MAEMKNICGKIPMELHTKVRQEIEQREISTQQFIQQVIEEHFTEKGGQVSMVTRTVAVQVSNELFERFKAAVAKKGCKQKDFLIELLERAIEEIEAEFGETVSGTPSQGEEPESTETENEETTEEVETEEVSELAEAETGEGSEEAETEEGCDCESAEAGEAPEEASEDAQTETSENTEPLEEPEEQEPDTEESFEPEPDEADIA
ncbi:MAG: hypothetical protein K1W40_13150 [Schaedlerella sp.]|uniref:hypothetical protein n=1 Tax=Schaedlerella sp. TaxID=2676057 RepID=UPI00265DE9F8|nr:hypothetical protein [uncultured Schaedlerella sp.]